MLVPKTILAGDIEKVFDAKGGQYLESYTLFDVYEGAQIGKDFKSLAYTLTFRGQDKTLEDSDIQPGLNKILKNLEEMGIELRK